MQNEKVVLATIRQVARMGVASECLLRKMVKEKRCPGVYQESRFYINLPMLIEQLNAESEVRA